MGSHTLGASLGLSPGQQVTSNGSGQGGNSRALAPQSVGHGHSLGKPHGFPSSARSSPYPCREPHPTLPSTHGGPPDPHRSRQHRPLL